MRRTVLFFSLLFTLSFSAQEAPMTTGQIEELKSKVAALAERTTTITSDFVQLKHMDFMTHDIETKGKLAFRAPQMVRWQYTEPFDYSVIFRSDEILIDDGGNRSQVDIGSSKLFKELNDLIVSSINGDMFDEERFEIDYKRAESGYVVTFVPKDKEIIDFIGSFILHFDKKEADVQSVKMVEPSGDYTYIVFENRVMNSELGDEVFSY